MTGSDSSASSRPAIPLDLSMSTLDHYREIVYSHTGIVNGDNNRPLVKVSLQFLGQAEYSRSRGQRQDLGDLRYHKNVHYQLGRGFSFVTLDRIAGGIISKVSTAALATR